MRTVDIPSGAFEMLKGKVVVLMSDVHVGRDGSAHENEIRTKLAELRPDLILLTGDFVSWLGEKPDYQKAFSFLSTLDAPMGVFAVLGDADYSNERQSCGFCHSGDPIRPTPLNQVQFIKNSFVDVPFGSDTLRIAGFDAWAELKLDLQKLPMLIKARPTILLSHSSLIYASIPNDSDVLVLSGDTHGGEIYMPSFFWKLSKRKPDPDHIYGYYQDGNKKLYVTSGVGTDLPFRFGVPPEIVVLRFN